MDEDKIDKLFAAFLGSLGTIGLIALLATLLLLGACGCAYKGGKVIDGTNIAIGMTIPGTEWSVNVLDYVGGMRVAGNDQTRISVTNEVAETNSYFGVVTTTRRTKLTAEIAPCEVVDGRGDEPQAEPREEE